jgi:hypothetical protein
MGFALKGVLKKRIFLAGIDAGYQHVRGATVCVGNCSAKFADREGLPSVPGCPPAAKDILDFL